MESVHDLKPTARGFGRVILGERKPETVPWRRAPTGRTPRFVVLGHAARRVARHVVHRLPNPFLWGAGPAGWKPLPCGTDRRGWGRAGGGRRTRSGPTRASSAMMRRRRRRRRRRLLPGFRGATKIQAMSTRPCPPAVGGRKEGLGEGRWERGPTAAANSEGEYSAWNWNTQQGTKGTATFLGAVPRLGPRRGPRSGGAGLLRGLAFPPGIFAVGSETDGCAGLVRLARHGSRSSPHSLFAGDGHHVPSGNVLVEGAGVMEYPGHAGNGSRVPAGNVLVEGAGPAEHGAHVSNGGRVPLGNVCVEFHIRGEQPSHIHHPAHVPVAYRGSVMPAVGTRGICKDQVAVHGQLQSKPVREGWPRSASSSPRGRQPRGGPSCRASSECRGTGRRPRPVRSAPPRRRSSRRRSCSGKRSPAQGPPPGSRFPLGVGVWPRDFSTVYLNSNSPISD